ncbi:hypothetical protein AB0H76_24785 [Nocardia sp. NPDC050712]|uniref:hypothetical protein n=1 Tax=Nocardia sp. NPDC050712 TaxID=3155518 RepID=UPI0033FE158A
MTSPRQVLVGGVVGAMIAALAVAAHGAAGGGFPGSAEAALVLLVAAPAACLAATLPAARSRLGVLLMLAGGQFAGHAALSVLDGHDHAQRAQLPAGWMLLAHGVATLLGGAVILLAQRLYLVVSGAIRSVLARPPRWYPPAAATGWAAPGLAPYRFHPNGARGPRAPPAAA